MKQLASSYDEQYQHQEVEFQKLLNAKLRLEAKLTEVRQERVRLQAMLDLAKSKELTHKVVEGVAGVTSAEAGLKEIKDEIQKRLDKATAQGEIDASRLEKQMADVLEEDQLRDQLAARKVRMGLK
jgi:phage shock protein A